ncbi:hypothetical protein VTO42DRAFT_6235 [Malbranchea cinnamomea]
MDEGERPASSSSETPQAIDLAACPPIFVLPTHLELDELHEVEETLGRCSARLTYNINEASWVLGKISQKKRASLELRSRGLWTEEVSDEVSEPDQKRPRLETPPSGVHPVKQPQIVDLTVQSDVEEDGESDPSSGDTRKKVLKPPDVRPASVGFPLSLFEGNKHIRVVKLDWLQDSLEAGRVLPPGLYTIYCARKIPCPRVPSFGQTSTGLSSLVAEDNAPTPSTGRDGVFTSGIIERAKADTASTPPPSSTQSFGRFRRPRHGHGTSQNHNPRPKLYRQSTSEHEDPTRLPPLPDWVTKKLVYSCQRSTPLHPPNEAFINQLLKIKKIRELTLDEIGVRAYSTSIAAIAAYPYPLQSPEEVLSLPGCDSKIANLFVEWKESSDGTLEAASQLDTDPVLSILNLFNNIWGVGARTARGFYYQRQWQSLDDIIQHGWDSLSRVQQIGVKYYDEFLEGISRTDVKKIGDVVLEHAKRVRPGSDYDGKGIECIIVGGYRRGKERNGDVDIIVTHRDERVTLNLVYDIVASLEQEGWITHTLALHLTNSNRDQQTLPYRGESHGKPRFDSLDKALVVWQDPNFEDPYSPDGDGVAVSPSQTASQTESSESENEKVVSPSDSSKSKKRKRRLDTRRASNPHPETATATASASAASSSTTTTTTTATTKKRNPNPHRRVDIIISPWRTVGCAVLGWSGDTTFQRDLRRYAKKVHNWKFDSSGIRSRDGGRVIDLESGGETWEERERLVMEGLGVGWRPPEERCTR